MLHTTVALLAIQVLLATPSARTPVGRRGTALRLYAMAPAETAVAGSSSRSRCKDGALMLHEECFDTRVDIGLPADYLKCDRYRPPRWPETSRNP
jgi:hypothetical protein